MSDRPETPAPPGNGGSIGPTVAGSWYPAEARALGGEVDRLLTRSSLPAVAPAGFVRALIAPHAGYVYSGAVAGVGFAHLRDAAPARVILVGPSHYARFRGAALPTAATYRTPLGAVPLDVEAIRELVRAPDIELRDSPFLPEHCLEAEIPFLQRALHPGWRLIPMLLGTGSPTEGLARMAELVRPLVDRETLLVVSSDFTHYGPRFGYVPFERDVPRELERLDRGAVDRIVSGDVASFEDYLTRTGATICGRHAIGLLMRLAPDEWHGRLLAYDTSGRMTGEWGHSVSYASVAFLDRAPAEDAEA